MISVPTQRFGTVTRANSDVITFPAGIFGFELNLRWLLLGDRSHGGLYWLQNVEDSSLSLPITDPRELVQGYALHVRRRQLTSIWRNTEPLIVMSVLTEYEGELCLNLRNPIAINPQRQIGAQVVASDQQPLQYPLSAQSLPLRKSA